MALFANMPLASINGWLLWADAHDWGQGTGVDATAHYDEVAGELVTYAWESREGDPKGGAIVEARHKSPRELKAWAGY